MRSIGSWRQHATHTPLIEAAVEAIGADNKTPPTPSADSRTWEQQTMQHRGGPWLGRRASHQPRAFNNTPLSGSVVLTSQVFSERLASARNRESSRRHSCRLPPPLRTTSLRGVPVLNLRPDRS